MKQIQNLFDELNFSKNFTIDFLHNAEIITLKKREFFVKENETCNYIGIVKTGSLYSCFENDNADILVNELYQPLSFISSYRSFLSQIESPANFRATVDCEIYVISHQKYLKLKANNEWMIFFKTYSDSLFLRKCLKETSLIKFSAKERYQLLIRTNPSIELIFPQYLIASYLKMRPETLSRLKSLDLSQHKLS